MSATQQEATTGLEPRGWRLAGKQAALHWPLTAIATWAVLLLGGALRLFHLDALSYWLDEGITVYDTRREWDVVFGLHGRYAEHPPLYHVLAKLFAVVFPDNIAARVLSFVTGTLTIVVLYFLVVALLNRRAAIVACLALAISPLHIWYSQEARMYAPTMFAVALSYLMLVLFYKSPQTRWAAGYGVSVLAAVYMDYSAMYALAPQVLLVLLTLWKHRRRSVPLIVAGVVAVLLYPPWFPQMMATAEQWRGQRDSYLAPTPYRVSTSILSVIGAGGDASTTGEPHVGYYWGLKYTAWDMGLLAPKAPLDPVLLVRVVILLGMGAVVV
ncbi:MAG TPA: glycosyltransferase family 39 protein, partial [Chloroflexia bacterium]